MCLQSWRPNRNSLDLAKMPTSRIRNFSIVAHIDHGKTTLSDRLLALAGTTEPEKDKAGVRRPPPRRLFISTHLAQQESSSLDALPVERARGITVKAHTTSLMVRFRGEEYLLNLIDTPGHVDFTYEVSRSLRACEGTLPLPVARPQSNAATQAPSYSSTRRKAYRHRR